MTARVFTFRFRPPFRLAGWGLALLALAAAAGCHGKSANAPTSPSTVGDSPAGGSPALDSVTLSTAMLVGGPTVTGTITLTAAAPTGGITVTVTANSSAALVPSSVLVPTGTTSQTFLVFTVSQTTTRTVSITASYGGVTKSVELVVAATPPQTLSGQATDVLGGWGIGGVSLDGGDLGTFTSGTDGTFLVGYHTTGTFRVTSARSGYVSRSTSITAPGRPVLISMIPSTFNLEAYDQMFRTFSGGALTRWSDAPALVVERAMAADEKTAVALDAQITDAEMDVVIDRMTAALPGLTGGVFQSFKSIERRTTLAGRSIDMIETGAITVVHYPTPAARTSCGRGGPAWETGYVVRAGRVWLDRDWLHCGTGGTAAHELGHALGYGHVSGVASIMNSPSMSDLTAFDRQSTIVGFARPQGSRAPDTDPDERPVNALAAAGAPGLTVPAAQP